MLAGLTRLLLVAARSHRLVTPGTALGWHRRLVAKSWGLPDRFGRPRVPAEVAGLVERLARDNASWAHVRIHGEMRKLGHRVAGSTIRRVLKHADTAGADPPA